MQRTDPPAGSAESEKSRTESEGQARPLFLPRKGALPRPKLSSRRRKDGFHVNQCKYVAYRVLGELSSRTLTQIPRAK